jgi:hypothetical protein
MYAKRVKQATKKDNSVACFCFLIYLAFLRPAADWSVFILRICTERQIDKRANQTKTMGLVPPLSFRILPNLDQTQLGLDSERRNGFNFHSRVVRRDSYRTVYPSFAGPTGSHVSCTCLEQALNPVFQRCLESMGQWTLNAKQ